MAYTRKTIINQMLEDADLTPSDVSMALGYEPDYVDRIINGVNDHPSVNTLAMIARECGYELCFVGNGRTLPIRIYRPTAETTDATFEASGESVLTGKTVAITGDLFGLNEEAQESLLKSIGASFDKRVRKKTTDVLVVGDLTLFGGTSKQLVDAERWGKETITDDALRTIVLDATGVDIANV